MKIAVTSPFGWPYVRRGNRVAYELAVYLARQGNDVHFITTKPGAVRRDKIKGNLTIKYYPVVDNPFLTAAHIEYWQTFGLTCLRALLKGDYDMVHPILTMDAFAASLNRSFKGTPFIPVVINGDPLYADARWAKRLFHRVVTTASRLVTISNFVNNILHRDFGVDGVMIPCPVDTSKFYYTEKENSDPPKILCTATLIMERKRVPLLIKAFEVLIEKIPDAILQLAGETTPEVTRNLLMQVNTKTRASIVIENITSDEVLASFYRNATVTVLPSLKEPFGMVTTESLACGTPVVGTRSGGTTEILDDPGVGVTFEPSDGPQELCEALIKGIELARNPETQKRCNEHAQGYSWNTLGPKYEELHSAVLNTAGRKSRSTSKAVEKSGDASVISNEDRAPGDSADQTVLKRFFVDTLDEQDITLQMYYEIERGMPRCIYILQWLLTRKIHKGNILVLSTCTHFLATLLRKLGFPVRHVVINNGADTSVEKIDCEILQDPQSLAEWKEHFSVIVCDNLLPYMAAPDRVFQILKKRLSPNGVLLVTTPNVNQYANRFNLRSGFNANRDDIPLNGSPGMNRQQLQCLREYTLADVEEAAAKAGLTVLQQSYLTGEKHIDKTNNFAHVPLKNYILHKMCFTVERFIAPLRSHLFLALKNRDRNKENAGNLDT